MTPSSTVRADAQALDPGALDIEALDLEALRRDFPGLHQEIHGHPLAYLDNAASAHKPTPVLEALRTIYTVDYSNVHRGVHTLSQRATDAYEKARATVRAFLGAERDDEIVFTRGTTEAINLVANTFGRERLGPGDEVILTHLEHHSNIVPWQLVCQQTGASIRVVPIDDRGQLDLDAFEDALADGRAKMVSVIHVSNALGTVNPVEHLVERAHAHGVPVFVDGAQAAPHGYADVARIGCDFYACSSHKLFGPTGLGVLYGRREHLASMPPWQGGGDMILSVSFEKTEYNVPPHRFEAGTPHIAGAVGLTAAIDYVTELGLDRLEAHEQDLLAYATERVAEIPGLTIVGMAERKASVVSFTLDGVHPHDIGTILDHEGVAIRAGHHCTQPLMDRLGLAATARASFAFYNTRAEVDRLVDALGTVVETFGDPRSEG